MHATDDTFYRWDAGPYLYEVCHQCNYARHRCHFCGADLDHTEDFGTNGRTHACYLDNVPHEDADECPVNGVHEFRVHDDSPAGSSRAVYCEHCGQSAPVYDEDGFAIPTRRRVPTS